MSMHKCGPMAHGPEPVQQYTRIQLLGCACCARTLHLSNTVHRASGHTGPMFICPDVHANCSACSQRRSALQANYPDGGRQQLAAEANDGAGGGRAGQLHDAPGVCPAGARGRVEVALVQAVALQRG